MIPLAAILALGLAWLLLWLATRRSERMLQRELRSARFDTEGELLPALWDDRPPNGAIMRLPAADPLPASELETRRPQRAPSLESDVFVPALQSAFTALAGAIVSGLLALGLGWSWRVVAITTAAVLALAWLWRLHLVDGLLWSVETLLQHDVDRDGTVGRPHMPVVVNPATARSVAADVAVASATESRKRDLMAFVHRCAALGCSERAHGVSATGPERSRYLELRDTLFSLGLAAWRNPDKPRAGWYLTTAEAEAQKIILEHVV